MLNKYSCRIAKILGEKRGRSVSRICADGLTTITGGRINCDASMNIVHGIMIGIIAGKLSKRALLRKFAGWGTIGLLLMWIVGQDK